MDRRRFIKLSGREIQLTPDSKLDLRYTNFPDEMFAFHEGTPFYWEIVIEQYEPTNGIIKATVSDYAPSEVSSFEEQTLKRQVRQINFMKLEWESLQPFLAMYRKKELKHLLENEREFDKEKKEKLSGERMTFEFTTAFKDADFCLGFVAVQRYFNYFDQELEIKIYNSEIMPEYHLIRNFFPKAFGGKKKFNVSAEIIHSGNEILELNAFSPEIKAINEKVIDTVKQYRSLQLSRSSSEPGVDKSLFTSDELTTDYDDKDPNGNIYQQEPKDILKCLLAVKDVRNKKQLEYLAGHQQSTDQKIRFTLHPLFGFLFFIEGAYKNHFCWELLDSHATYLWTISKSGNFSQQLRRIEETISLIREVGRNRYKSSFRNHDIDTDLQFNVIPHFKANSPVVDGFVYWKRELKGLLV